MVGDTLHCCYREQIAYTLFTKFREPKLYKMAQRGEWDLIPARCESHPKEAEFKHRYAPNDTVLHRLLRAMETRESSTTLEDIDEATKSELGALKMAAIYAILAASRGIVSIQDAYGRTPLHYACMNMESLCGIETVEMIARANVSAGCIQDYEGRTPLHYLVARHDVIPIKTLELLVALCPDAVRTEDMVKETPVSILHRRRDEVAEVDVLLKFFQSV